MHNVQGVKGGPDVTAGQAQTFTNWRWRGTSLLGFVALLPLLAFAIFATLSALGSYRTADEARLRDTARALAAAVDAQLGSYVVALETLATSPLFDGALDADVFDERVRPVGERLGGWIVLFDEPPGYQMLANTRRQPGAPLPSVMLPEQQLALRSAHATLFSEGRTTISDLFQCALTDVPVLAVIIPVDRPGQRRRALALVLEPTALRSFLAQHRLPPGTFAAIADGQLRIVAHSSDPEVRLVDARAPDWIAAAIEGREQTLIVGPGWTGPDNVYAVERLTRTAGWVVGVYERRASQQASAWAVLRWLLAGGAAFSLGLAVLVWASRREAVRNAQRETMALSAGRAEVERLHAGLPAAIFLRELKPDGTSRLVYRGGDLETVTGGPAVTFTGVEGFQSHVDPGAEDYRSFFERVAREGAGSVEYRTRQPDGSWRFLMSQCRVLTRQQDGTCEIVGYIFDVSAEREAQARALAGSKLASLGEMAAGLAHEMKQPLQAISLAAELGQSASARGDTAEVERRLELIVKQTQRTADIIEHVRRFARGDEDKAPPQAVPLTAAVEGALDLARHALHEASVSVEVDLGDVPPVVHGQKVLLEQVLTNLLLNARDALTTRPAGAPRQVRIAAAPGPEGTVRLMVADTGGGIAPEVMARLFEPFVTTKGPDKGTGIGLSICHGLVKGMGGSIEGHNNAAGAVFIITLPSAKADEALAAQRQEITKITEIC